MDITERCLTYGLRLYDLGDYGAPTALIFIKRENRDSIVERAILVIKSY